MKLTPHEVEIFIAVFNKTMESSKYTTTQATANAIEAILAIRNK